MDNNIVYRKISIECTLCKTKFDIWISDYHFTPELEENIRKNFYHQCPICKALEKVKED